MSQKIEAFLDTCYTSLPLGTKACWSLVAVMAILENLFEFLAWLLRP
jgi:hypothetical protein